MIRLKSASQDLVGCSDEDCDVPDIASVSKNSNVGRTALRTQTLRQSAARVLDALSSFCSKNILPVILPLLQERLAHSDVWIRESGILALGAIAGQRDNLDEHMRFIFP